MLSSLAALNSNDTGTGWVVVGGVHESAVSDGLM